MLLTLPAHPFDTDLIRVVRSDKTIYVRFDQNDYSIPPEAVGRALTLVASPGIVRILDGATQLAQLTDGRQRAVSALAYQAGGLLAWSGLPTEHVTNNSSTREQRAASLTTLPAASSHAHSPMAHKHR